MRNVYQTDCFSFSTYMPQLEPIWFSRCSPMLTITSKPLFLKLDLRVEYDVGSSPFTTPSRDELCEEIVGLTGVALTMNRSGEKYLAITPASTGYPFTTAKLSVILRSPGVKKRSPANASCERSRVLMGISSRLWVSLEVCTENCI